MRKHCVSANSFASKSDYHRLDRMPTCTYKKVLKLHDEFVDVRKKIDEVKGLISPIRAIVISYDSCGSKLNFLSKAINAMLGLKLDIEVDKFSFDKITVSPEDTVFMNRSSIVGYCVALPDPDYPEAPYKVGVSYCVPNDFRYFNKEFGIIQAYKRALEYNSCTGMVPVGGENQFLSGSGRGNYFYLWPNSYQHQVDAFFNRADKYFKPIKENK